MKQIELLRYSLKGISDDLTREQTRLPQIKSESMLMAAKERIKELERKFSEVSDLIYTEETGQTR